MGEDRRKEQQAATRARIVEVAERHVREKGPAVLSLREVAAEAAVAVGLPFAHFGSREGLLDELRLRVWDRIDGVITAAIERRVPGPGFHERRVRAAVRALVGWAHAEPRLYALVAPAPGEPASTAVQARERRVTDRLVEVLDEGRRTGELHFERPPAICALALWAGVQGHVRKSAVQDEVLDEILDAFFVRTRRTRSL